MSGFFFALGHCIGCGNIFSFNPDRVPSCSAITGKREPICLDCVERVNPIRIANGLPPIRPLPGAYDATPEDEASTELGL